MGKNELEELLALERELVFRRFTSEDAWKLGGILVRKARERRLPVAIDIVRHGHRLFHFAFEGTSPNNEEWIRRKARVVDLFGHSSFYVGRELASAGTAMRERHLLDETLYAAHGGAFPLIIEGVGPVGHVAVSGLPQADDHALVVEAIREFLAEDAG